jgi:DNA polymerase III delta prime subunit
METYASNAIFILTANNENKVVEPIKSRCLPIPFAYPDKGEIFNYLCAICNTEDIKYTKEGVQKLIDINYPSIRNCVMVLQDIKSEEKEVTVDTIVPFNMDYEEMWNLLKQKKWQEIKNKVMASTIDARELNTYFWQKSLDTEDLKMIQITCRNEKDIALGADAKVIFVTGLIEMVK